MHVCSLWQGLSNGTIIEHVTLTVTFLPTLKNFNIGHNFFILWDKAFIFGMSVRYDEAFSNVPSILSMWPWLWPLTDFSKTLTSAIILLSSEIGHSYLACVFLMTWPFRQYRKFWHVTLNVTFDLLLKSFNIAPANLRNALRGPSWLCQYSSSFQIQNILSFSLKTVCEFKFSFIWPDELGDCGTSD